MKRARPPRLYEVAKLISVGCPSNYPPTEDIYPYLMRGMTLEVARGIKRKIRDIEEQWPSSGRWARKARALIGYAVGQVPREKILDLYFLRVPVWSNSYEEMKKNVEANDIYLMAFMCSEETGIRSRVFPDGRPCSFDKSPFPFYEVMRPYLGACHSSESKMRTVMSMVGLWYVEKLREYGAEDSDLPEIIFSGRYDSKDLSDAMDLENKVNWETWCAVNAALSLEKVYSYNFYYRLVMGYVSLTNDRRRGMEVFYETMRVCDELGLPT